MSNIDPYFNKRGSNFRNNLFQKYLTQKYLTLRSQKCSSSRAGGKTAYYLAGILKLVCRYWVSGNGLPFFLIDLCSSLNRVERKPG
jgi:hypothetical protein